MLQLSMNHLSAHSMRSFTHPRASPKHSWRKAAALLPEAYSHLGAIYGAACGLRKVPAAADSEWNRHDRVGFNRTARRPAP